MKLLTAVVALLVVATPAFAQDEHWSDTHRVILRNGNTVDGVLSEDSTHDVIVIRFSPTSQLAIKSLDIQRVEEIKVRQHGDMRRVLDMRAAEAAKAAAEKRTPITNTTGNATLIESDPVLEFEAFKANAILSQVKGDVRNAVDKHIAQLGIVDDKEAKDAILRLGPGAVLYAASRLPTLQPIVVNRVIEVLMNSKEKRLPTILRPMTTSANDDLVAVVLRTLVRLQDKTSLDLYRKHCGHASAVVRSPAAQGVADMGTVNDFPLLVSMVVAEDAKTRDIGSRTLASAASRLNRNAAAVEALRAVYSRTSGERADGIAPALGFIRCPEGTDLLRRMLTNGSADIRGAAAKAIGASMAAKAVPDLHTMIKSEKDAAAKMEAARALMIIKDEASTRPLVAAMSLERDPDVVEAIHKALQRITGKDFEAKYERWQKWLDTGK